MSYQTNFRSFFRSLHRALLQSFSGMIFSPLGSGTAAAMPHPEPDYASGRLGRTGLLLGLLLGIFLALGVGSAPAEARVQAKVSDIHYSNCPPELAHNLVLGGGVMSANCFLIQGTVHNDSGKVLLNADVFGRIYDANGNDAMPERGRLGSVDSVPLGDSPFEIMVTVPADQPEPLTLKQFKISGFTGKVRR
jgi:hypothetical protein